MLHPLNWAGKGFLELDAGMVMSTKLGGGVNMRMVVSISPPSLPDRKVELGSSCNKYHNKNSSCRIWSARFKSGWSSDFCGQVAGLDIIIN